MRGTKWLVIAMALCMALSILAGCAKDNTQDILGTVGETPIYRWYFDAHLTKQLALYETYYGIDLTKASYKAQFEEYKVARLRDLVGLMAMKEDARVRGLYELSAEQQAHVDQLYSDYYNATIASFVEEYGADSAGLRKAEDAYLALLEASSLTPERMRQTLLDNYVLELLTQELASLEPVTDELIRQTYDANLAAQKEKFEADKTAFATSVLDSTIYIPEGYIETVRITKKFTVQQNNKIAQVDAIYKTALEEYLNEAMQSGESSAAAKAKKAALDRVDANLTSTVETCQKELEASLMPILDAVKGGADFLATMEKESDDRHLISYFVCEESEHVDEAYRDAALRLTNVGDISGIVPVEGGICIIMLKERLTPGIRSYEEVYEAIKTELQQNQTRSISFDLQSTYAQKAEDAGIVTLYEDML